MPRQLRIGPDLISDDSPCYVIAEIGHNHQGQLKTALELFRAAKECGVNSIKLQKRDNRSLYTRAMYEKPYENENSFGLTYGAHREALEFGRSEYVALQNYARELGLTMFATAFDFRSADFLAELDMPAYKIASGDLTNIPLIKHVAGLQKPILVSTGGGSMADVQRAYEAVMPINPQLCLLQCTASYPAEPQAMNLRVINTFRDAFPDATVGLSDHQNGISMPVAAYVLGARVIEKHFTLNHASKGTDHAFSLEPIGMRKMVRDLRRTAQALGDGIKQPHPDEKSALFKMGKKLVAARDLPAGHVLQPADVAIKSPNDGLPPYYLDQLIGKVIQRPLLTDQEFVLADLEGRA
jgi:sialic acid synthase